MIVLVMINRFIESNIQETLDDGKAVILLGARQVGKTTVIKSMFGDKRGTLFLNGDDIQTRTILENISEARLRAIIGENKLVIIDEAQKVSDIGEKLKLITDQMPDVRVIATGSSSFELSGIVNETLTGRKRECLLYPISFSEMVKSNGLIAEISMINHRLVYGYYPEVVSKEGRENRILKELVDSYLYKDILSMGGVSKIDRLIDLVRALAFQVGSQVSFNELSNLVKIDAKTVERYLNVLEKSFIIFRLPSFAKNLRNEIKFDKKIYFWDLGVRNAVIGNFAPVEVRDAQEVGHLWENFLIAERMKKLSYNQTYTQSYFWRTVQNREIDLIETVDGTMSAYEFKWRKDGKASAPKQFVATYPESSFKVITPDNVDEFLL